MLRSISTLRLSPGFPLFPLSNFSSVRRLAQQRLLSVRAPLRQSHAPLFQSSHAYAHAHPQHRQNLLSVAYYTASVIVLFSGLSYAAVPLYKIVCTQSGLDGTPITDTAGHRSDPDAMRPVLTAKRLKITFNADVSDSMRWKFAPDTREIHVLPGETALAFYSATNPTDEDVTGISTYSVVPAKAAQYFNKIQCFCFEEQRLLAGEQVDMPVFFYIDPEFADDPWMKDVDTITLSYTFFRAKNGKMYKL